MPTDFTSVFEALVAARVRFVVAGGLAVLLHGVDRLTADIDLALDLAPEQAKLAMATLLTAGFRPVAPVDALQFADPLQRAEWRAQRGMAVFSLWDPAHRRPTVDVFAELPIPFEELLRDSIEVSLGAVRVRIASVTHLIRMKAAVGRPKDLQDIEALRGLPGRVRS